MSWFSAWWPFGTAYKTAAPSQDRASYAGSRSRDLTEDDAATASGRKLIGLEGYDIRRNNCVAAGISKTLSDSVVGPFGIQPQASTSDPAWNEQAESFFHEWSKIADSRQRGSLQDLQRVAVNARLFAGDMGFLFTDGGQLQPIEGNRIFTPSDLREDSQIVDGVRLTPSGIPLQYFINERADKKTGKESFAKIDAPNICFVRSPAWRPDSVRGVAEVNDVLNSIKDLAELMDNINRRARAEAGNGAVVTTAEGSGKINAMARLDRSTTASTEQIGTVHEKIDGWKTFYLRPGEDVKHPALSAPGGNYVPYILSQMHIIGSGLRIPGEFLMMHFDASFSASQVALTSFYQTCESWEQWLINSLLQRVWNWRIAKAIKDGELPPAPVDGRGISEWYKVKWVGPRRNWLDPQKQSAADLANWKMGVEDIATIAKRNTGLDYETQLLPMKEQAIIAAIESAKRISARTGVPIGWEKMIEVTNSVSADATPRQDEPQPKGAADD